ncbi:hypothetical protein LLH06_06850 [Mucilaginibacter daejeonensis]|uniref:hypothetical protein n=1 Tax=Mucilaginibacter daejeonensis TaxID=398049 RepID=UPI001D172545|nr:hypothetical protein [Mucilaginibacter daejeonensis]UEG54678.1 hypothetical protein LLH06_06850 [Mucilaginibacter daejeonensis]
MKNGLFEYGDQVVINATDEKGTVNSNQLKDGEPVEVELTSGEVKQYNEDELAFDEDYQPDTGE